MATGVRISRPDKETTFWLACPRDAVQEPIRVLWGHFGVDAAYFGPGLVAEFGESDGATFTAAETLDLKAMGFKV